MKKTSFSQVYNQICLKHGKTLEKMRKDVLIKELIIIAITIIGIVCGYKNMIYSPFAQFYFLIVMVVVLIIMFIIARISKRYAMDYKMKAINVLVQESNPSYTFYPKKGISSADYNASGFDRTWDKFFSEDFISGKLDDNISVKMSQVKTQEIHEYTDSDGHRRRETVTTFLGLYGIIMLPFLTNMDMKILNNSMFKKFNKSRVEMESSEFEKYFDVFTVDRVGAMEVLTPESIEKIVQLRNLHKKHMNIRINGRYIYFRIENGDIFEPPTFRSVMNFDMLYKYFNIIDAPRAIYESVIDNIMMKTGNHDEIKKRQIKNMTPEQKEEYEAAKKKKEEESWFTTN